MRTRGYALIGTVVLMGMTLALSGCAVNFLKKSPRTKEKIQNLEAKIDELERLRRAEREHFEDVKRMLEKKLGSQIAGKQVSLEMQDGGLVIILSDDILFDSGQANVKEEAYDVLNGLIEIIKRELGDKNIGVSGHTDNVPIKYSGWASNWELSSARATNVLHYLEGKGIPSKRLSATGYGEHRPIAANTTLEGRSKNRRVEIAILPEYTEKREGSVKVDTTMGSDTAIVK